MVKEGEAIGGTRRLLHGNLYVSLFMTNCLFIVLYLDHKVFHHFVVNSCIYISLLMFYFEDIYMYV